MSVDPTVNIGISVAQQVQPSVALVTPVGVRQMKSRGSGFVINAALLLNIDNGTNGQTSKMSDVCYMITAAHVAAPGLDIRVNFNGDEFQATVLARNQTLDLALLQVNLTSINSNTTTTNTRPKPLEIATSLPLVGTTTFAHGYPASRLQGPAMTSGIVCGIARGLGLPDMDDYGVLDPTGIIQGNNNNDTTLFVVTNAAMASGMSGGPLTDTNGCVLGVNALIRPDLRALGNYAVSAQEVVVFLEHYVQQQSSILLPNNVNNNQRQYTIYLYNDPMNKKERVATILQTVANMTAENATQTMMQAHRTGRAIISQFEGQQQSEAEALCRALKEQDLLVEVSSDLLMVVV